MKSSLKSSFKSVDTEEFIDIHFYRPIGYRWALFFNKLGVTPNQITIASLFIGVAAGICFYFEKLEINLLGIFLLIWANSFDSADGQLARMTSQKTELGRILDGLSSIFWFTSIYIAIILRLWPEWNFLILILALSGSFFHTNQTSMADYYRNLHLLFLKGKKGSELANSVELAKEYASVSWKTNPLLRLSQKAYIYYTKNQEFLTPALQEMMKIIHTQYDGTAPEWLREEFRKSSFPLLKYTNMLTFNLRSIILFISIITGFLYLYFIFEITVLNLILFYMVRKYESICKKLIVKLNKN